MRKLKGENGTKITERQVYQIPSTSGPGASRVLAGHQVERLVTEAKPLNPPTQSVLEEKFRVSQQSASLQLKRGSKRTEKAEMPSVNRSQCTLKTR